MVEPKKAAKSAKPRSGKSTPSHRSPGAVEPQEGGREHGGREHEREPERGPEHDRMHGDRDRDRDRDVDREEEHGARERRDGEEGRKM